MNDSERPPDQLSQLKRLGSIALRDFTGDLEDLARATFAVKSVLSSLEVVADDVWVKEVRRQWGQLEVLYALVLEDGRASLTNTEQADAFEIVASLKRLFGP